MSIKSPAGKLHNKSSRPSSSNRRSKAPIPWPEILREARDRFHVQRLRPGQ